MTGKLNQEKNIIEVYKNIIQIIDDFKSTKKSMEIILNNIAVYSIGFDLEKFLGIFVTKKYVDAIVKELEDNLRKIEKAVGELDGIDQKVVYKRDIEGKSLGAIAYETGYSLGYIKNISSRNPKKEKIKM